MSNKRDLKRTINYICGDLFTEGIAASLYGENRDNDNTEANPHFYFSNAQQLHQTRISRSAGYACQSIFQRLEGQV